MDEVHPIATLIPRGVGKHDYALAGGTVIALRRRGKPLDVVLDV